MPKKYKLTDGSEVTVNEVANKVYCPTQVAYTRLARSKDPKMVYKPWMPKNKKTKLYTLDDGKIVTAKEVSKKVGCFITLARVRLSQSSDPKKVFAPLVSKKEKERQKEIQSKYTMDRIHSRGMFDEMLCKILKII